MSCISLSLTISLYKTYISKEEEENEDEEEEDYYFGVHASSSFSSSLPL